VPAKQVTIVEILPESPAQSRGIAAGDVVSFVLAHDDAGDIQRTDVMIAGDLQSVTRANLGREMTLGIRRGSDELLLPVVPRTQWPQDQGPIGVRLEDTKVVQYSWIQAPWEALKLNGERIGEIFASLGGLVTRLVRFESVSRDVAGPIRIAQVTSMAHRVGFRALVELISIISINLAVLNVLPIPALDGGRLLFVLIEKITGRKVRASLERSSHQIGMIILLALVLLISINDILQIASGS
jgi:regulator of sigma E protease